ncbi:MAG: hypothetical protein NTY41_12425 [Proteobacteria bacterium]|nr:hypothetical protein [Pseudomonadota bacterium]
MNPIPGAVWRRRMQELARNVGKPHAPLFAPLMLGVAAQIEALALPEMVRNSTRLRKNVSELRRMLELPAVFCAVPSLIELEALGVPVNSEVWPPQQQSGAIFDLAAARLEPEALLNSERFAASVDVVRQFGADSSEPVIAVALTGPATLVAQLRSANVRGDDESIYEFVGRLLAVLVRLYAEAGAHLIQLHESQAPGEAEEHWKGALGTAGNVARFHRVPPLLVYAEDVTEPLWPMQVVPSIASPAEKPPTRAHAHAWAGDPLRWGVLSGGLKNERLVTSATEVPAEFALAELMDHVKRVCATAE